MRDNPEYFRKNKGVVYEITLVSPDHYFYLTSRARRRSGSSPQAERREVSDKRAKEYADKMKSGDKFPLMYIDFDHKSQEGRHRVRALEMLGVTNMPVMIVKTLGES